MYADTYAQLARPTHADCPHAWGYGSTAERVAVAEHARPGRALPVFFRAGGKHHLRQAHAFADGAVHSAFWYEERATFARLFGAKFLWGTATFEAPANAVIAIADIMLLKVRAASWTRDRADVVREVDAALEELGETLKRDPGAEFVWGTWSPDGREPPTDALTFSVQTEQFMTGCEGTVVYTGPSGSVMLYFDNPYMGDNTYMAIARGGYTARYTGTQGTHSQVTYVITKDAAQQPAPTVEPATNGPSTDESAAHVPPQACGPVVIAKKMYYDRLAAVAYAEKYALLPCSDGFVALAGKPLYYEFSGAQLDQHLNPFEKPPPAGLGLDMDDCTHFASCCIGKQTDAKAIGKPSSSRDPSTQTSAPRAKAGGLPIDQQQLGNAWMYGTSSAPDLLKFLLAKGFATVLFDKREKNAAGGDPKFACGSEPFPKGVVPGDLIAKFDSEQAGPGTSWFTSARGSSMATASPLSRVTPRAASPKPIHGQVEEWYQFLHMVD